MDARPPKPRVIVVDPNPRDRLVVVAALAPRFDVYPLPEGDDPLRAARGRRPELVLFALTRPTAEETLRYCRTLRTDVRPIERVAAYTRGAPVRPPEVVCDTWRADGYLAGTFDAAALLDYAETVLRAERTVRVPAPADGPWGRLVDRIRRRG